MKTGTTFFAVLVILFVGQTAQGQEIPNPGFENWSGGNPTSWYTSNVSGATTMTQSSTAHSGASSVRGEVLPFPFPGIPFFPNLVAGGAAQSIPITQNYSAFTGYYQWYPVVSGSGWTIYFTVNFFDAGQQVTAQGIQFASISTISSWQPFVVPMDYSVGTNNPAVSARIQITVSGQGNPNPSALIGSYFLLDDVAFSPPTNVTERADAMPSEFSLEQNYPNPFNPSTKINFDIPEQSFVQLKVFNLLGEEVATLVNEDLRAGSFTTEWNAAGMPSGVYMYSLNTGKNVLTKRMLLVK